MYLILVFHKLPISQKVISLSLPISAATFNIERPEENTELITIPIKRSFNTYELLNEKNIGISTAIKVNNGAIKNIGNENTIAKAAPNAEPDDMPKK